MTSTHNAYRAEIQIGHNMDPENSLLSVWHSVTCRNMPSLSAYDFSQKEQRILFLVAIIQRIG